MKLPNSLPLIAAVSLASSLHLSAEMVAEWQFNETADLPGGSEIKIDAVAKDAPVGSKLMESTTYVAGPSGLSDKWPAFLSTGYVDIGTGSGGSFANKNGLTTAGDYRAYFGGSGLEPGPVGFTAYLVVQPKSAWSGGGRRGIFSVGDWVGRSPSSGNISLTASEGKLTLTVGKGEMGARYDLTSDGDQSDFVSAQTSVSQTWDPAKWYFIGISAKEGAAPVLFVREMAVDGPAASPAGQVGTPTASTKEIWDRIPMELQIKEHEPIAIGATWVSFGNNPVTQDGADAKIAYVRLDNTFATVEQMDRVFAKLDDKTAAEAKAPTMANRPNTVPDEFKAMKWDTSLAGREIDLGQFRQTFNDDFKASSDISHDETGAGPWYAPGHSDFGAGYFATPGAGETYTIVEEGLRIRADKDEKGKWRTGNAQSVNRKGEGFAQQYGYFEMTAQFPKGNGSWIGLWLLSQNGYTDKSQTRTEIDIIEWYGGDPISLHPSVHLWPASPRFRPADANVTKHLTISGFKQGVGHKLFKDIMVDGHLQGFHSYGTEVTPEWVIMYFDRKEIGRIATVPEFKTPMYFVISLALLEKDMEKAVAPMDLIVKNVSAYQPKTPYASQ